MLPLDNGIPDFADGYGEDYGNGHVAATQAEGVGFVPVYLTLPTDVDPDTTTVTISYDASDPNGVQLTGSGTDEDPYLFVPASGTLRLWTRDASHARSAEAFDTQEYSATEGYYVPAGTYTLSTLFDRCNNGVAGPIVLYAEGVALAPDGPSPTGSQRLNSGPDTPYAEPAAATQPATTQFSLTTQPATGPAVAATAPARTQGQPKLVHVSLTPAQADQKPTKIGLDALYVGEGYRFDVDYEFTPASAGAVLVQSVSGTMVLKDSKGVVLASAPWATLDFHTLIAGPDGKVKWHDVINTSQGVLSLRKTFASQGTTQQQQQALEDMVCTVEVTGTYRLQVYAKGTVFTYTGTDVPGGYAPPSIGTDVCQIVRPATRHPVKEPLKAWPPVRTDYHSDDAASSRTNLAYSISAYGASAGPAITVGYNVSSIANIGLTGTFTTFGLQWVGMPDDLGLAPINKHN